MEEIIDLNHTYTYEKLVQHETMHPLISVIDYTKVPSVPEGEPFEMKVRYGYYAVFLKEVMCGDLKYGKNTYDYQEGTLVFVAPGQVLSIIRDGKPKKLKGWALLFHPDLLHGTQLGKNIQDYTFFSYETNEALHMSEQERQVIIDCFVKIQNELNHSIDKHSKTLIVSNIELLLNYCVRFYDRQFITRGDVNKDILTRFEKLINGYLYSEEPQDQGLPSVAYCADKLNLSSNYFGDLIKKETGKSAQEYIHSKIIRVAKEKLHDSTKTITDVAYELGFKYPQHFTRMFKNQTGYSPQEYQKMN